MSTGKTKYLFCYDICNEKRLVKIHRYLCKKAIPIQYSVFYAELTQNELQGIVDDLGFLIHPHDDIRIYSPLNYQQLISIGKVSDYTFIS